VRGGDQRPHLGRFLGRVAHHDPGHRRLEQGQELVVDRTLHQDAGAGTAVLPRIVEDAVRGSGGGQLHIGVGKDDVGALAPQLERDPLHLVGAAGHDGPPHLGRAGEADLAHGGMGHEALAHHAALPGQDLEDPFGESRFEGQLTDAQAH
jgi:hypothetical protein